MKKKEIVSTAVGAITGFTAMKATHNFVKAHQGKVGIFGIAGRIVIEATVCAATAGFAMTFSDKCIDIGTDIYNTVTGTENKKHEHPEYHSYYSYSSYPRTSGFVSADEFYDLCNEGSYKEKEVSYYVEDGTLVDDDGEVLDNQYFIDKIKAELDRKGDSDILYYFYSSYATVYEIQVLKCRCKEAQNGGES